MAHVSDNFSLIQSAFGARITNMKIDIRARLARRKVFNQTFRELAQLSDRDLADLGMHRSSIRSVAWDAAYKM